MHVTHFIYGYISHTAKEQLDNERKLPFPPHELHFPINSKESFCMYNPTTLVYTMYWARFQEMLAKLETHYQT